MNVIEVKNVTKHFKNFTLDNVSITLPKGYIMGLIGANGAGKTTLIKLIMGLYLKDGGDMTILNLEPQKDGNLLRDRIGFVFDNPLYYDFKLNRIIKIIRPFYSNWDNSTYEYYLKRFNLKKSLRFKTLSRGMKLKFALTIALSHKAELLILDEPTSGLDPIFRIELLSILQELITDGETSILFSSHITSDIEKIADYITYLKDGRVEFSKDRDSLFEDYLLIKGNEDVIPEDIQKVMIGGQITPYSYEALIPRNHRLAKSWHYEERASLEQIMLYYEKGSDFYVEANC